MKMVREDGIEPSTSGFSGRRSTPELPTLDGALPAFDAKNGSWKWRNIEAPEVSGGPLPELSSRDLFWSGQWDSNPQSPLSESGTLPD